MKLARPTSKILFEKNLSVCNTLHLKSFFFFFFGHHEIITGEKPNGKINLIQNLKIPFFKKLKVWFRMHDSIA